ncbi:hypothetical protein [Planococcus wigleyi]|uniref:PD-(D/E)XK nuclease superfamily protein n=1 Tax=Planococcus wigleyi TaxID=2762216 RepID=A0ABR8WBW6_9BACL|nr:hypothetical protein [Planococcus wigleyi]MBD8014497.1 hypothetical protein [Planococcus wigleyi]
MVKQVKSSFKLYQKFNSNSESTLFELVSGKNNETKQTKCLAFLISKSPTVLSKILKISNIKNTLKNIESLKNYNYDFYRVDAEMISEGTPRIRRDITISFYKENKMKFVIVIEAKSVLIKNVNRLTPQLEQYLDKRHYSLDTPVPIVGVALSKYPYIFSTEKNHFISITWLEIINILYELRKTHITDYEDFLIDEYFKFITGVDTEMKFFEQEVLSVSASTSFDSIVKYHIHGCPHNQRGYKYKDTLFITFRKSGVMNKLYKIEEVLVVDTSFASYETELKKSHPHVANRILDYMKEEDVKNNWLKNAKTKIYRFYVLSKKESIELLHKPRIPNSSVRNGIYFNLSELLDTTIPFVKTSSKIQV